MMGLRHLACAMLLAAPIIGCDDEDGQTSAALTAHDGAPDDAATTDGAKSCECYYNKDCAGNILAKFCDITASCTHWKKVVPDKRPKLQDGLCIWLPAVAAGTSGGDAVLSSLSLAFRAYEQTVAADGAGDPDPTLWAQALAAAPDDGWRARVPNIVESLLDDLLGFDFMERNAYKGLADHGAVRAVEDRSAATSIVAAARIGLVDAVRLRNRDIARLRMTEFWESYPGYHPMHTGRCYPHGHDDYPYTGPLDCQVQSLQSIVDMLLAP